VPRRALYLKTILAKEAPREPMAKCQSCNQKEWKWRCKDCVGRRLLCGRCCRNEHGRLLFHRVEAWNGRYFAAGALWQVGLKIYLGHQGIPCPSTPLVEGEVEELPCTHASTRLMQSKLLYRCRGGVRSRAAGGNPD
jgi:hypothetical protein